MADKIYSVTEVVGTSTENVASAVDNAVRTAAKTLKNLDWFEVTEIRGSIKDGAVAQYQVGIKLGFRYES